MPTQIASFVPSFWRGGCLCNSSSPYYTVEFLFLISFPTSTIRRCSTIVSPFRAVPIPFTPLSLRCLSASSLRSVTCVSVGHLVSSQLVS